MEICQLEPFFHVMTEDLEVQVLLMSEYFLKASHLTFLGISFQICKTMVITLALTICQNSCNDQMN